MTKAKVIPTVTISFGDEVYRPAGYRIPQVGESYISKTGKVSMRSNLPPSGPRLIVRVFDADVDFIGDE